MKSGDTLTTRRYRSWAQEVRREIKRGSKGPATSRCGREDVIPVGVLSCLLKNRLCSDDFAVGRRPTFDQHARKGELAQRMCEEEQVAGKAGAGEEQAWQALARDSEQGPGPKADE